MAEVRNFSYELNPSAVERVGLRPALDRLAARLLEHYHRHLRINVDSSNRPPAECRCGTLPHCRRGPGQCRQTFGLLADRNRDKVHSSGAWMEVRDNGRGFDPSDLQEMASGLGLLSMEHYAADAGLESGFPEQPRPGTS